MTKEMTRTTLSKIFSVTIAFVIFGFIDNALMVLFGDAIDGFFMQRGITNTMLAAGFGNTFSDAIGILSGRWVEKLVQTKIPPVEDGDLSKNQIIFSETLGIIIGCLIGLTPLYFL